MAGSWNGMEKGQQRVTQSIYQEKLNYLFNLTLQQPLNLYRDRKNVTINTGHDFPLLCWGTLIGHCPPQPRKRCRQEPVNAFPVVIHSDKRKRKCRIPCACKQEMDIASHITTTTETLQICMYDQ